MASNPMQQFSVHKIGPEIKIAGIDLSFTNASLFMVLSASLILIFLFIGTKERKIIPNKIQLIAEMFYTFVAKMISDTAGPKAKPYFPFIFSLFMFVLFCNMVGMLPYSFTVTSHIIVTLIMALFIFIAVTIIGFAKHGFKYLSIFVPRYKKSKIADALIIMKRLALVKDKSIPAIFISGPILWTLNCCIGLFAINFHISLLFAFG